MSYKKEDYHKIVGLYAKQNWLLKKKDKLNELIDFCESTEHKDLVISLLERFHYLTDDTLGYLLNEITDYIINKSGFTLETTQIMAIAYDDEADSSQKILDLIKIPLFENGWNTVKTVNRFGACNKSFKEGKTQIIMIDEFIGSGKTLKGRIKQLKNDINGEFEFKCCFIAGIKEAVESIEKEGIEIFCPLTMNKGISGFYKNPELFKMENLMLGLELKLAQNINAKDLYEFSFGYGSAEALYSLDGCRGNTPNSVFPIFWWLQDNNQRLRNTLLTRYETGF